MFSLLADISHPCLSRRSTITDSVLLVCPSVSWLILLPSPLAVANREDIKAMSSDGARLITAASDGDKKAVKKFLKDGVDVNSRCAMFWP